jgi:uncharacterized protein YndB with AHSA1/START domain
MSNERTTDHATFVIERTLDAEPERVFAAWADPAAKSRWFGAGDGAGHSLDFRVGGSERNVGGPAGGAVYAYEATIYDIVAAERIAYAYEMTADGTRISVSLATVEFRPSSEGTRLVYTEHDAFLDGLDSLESREHGTNVLIDNLEVVLTGEHPAD